MIGIRKIGINTHIFGAGGVKDPFIQYLNASGETIDESNKGYSSVQIDYAISIFATCTNCVIDISGTNDHRTAASNDDLNTGLAAGNIYTLNDVLGAELHTDLNAANDSATEAITAFADHAATIDGATKVTIGQDITAMLPQGAEVIPSGDFSATTGWSISGNFSHDAVNEELDYDGLATDYASITFNSRLEVGKYYTFNFTIKNSASAAVINIIQGSSTSFGLDLYTGSQTWANGIYTIPFRCTYAAANARFYGYSTGSAFSIDDISMKELEVLGADLVTNGDFATDTDWTKGTGWTISGGTANCDGTQPATTLFYQGGTLKANGWSLVKYTLSNYSAGSIRVGSSAGYNTLKDVNGTYVFLIDATANSELRFAATADFIGSIDNVSSHELLVTKEIENSAVYSGTQYVLPIDTNNLAIPVTYQAESIVAQTITGETSATTGFTAANNAVLSVETTAVNVGNFAIKIDANGTPTASADCDIDFTVDNATVYRLSVDWRHTGVGLDWLMQVEGVTAASIAVGETTYATKVYYFTTADTTATLRFMENNISNNGGIYFDNLKLQKVTLS